MKLFYPRQFYDKNYRRDLFPLLKPFYKQSDFTDKQRIEFYGVSDNDYTFVDKIEDAEFVILTMSWLYYKLTNKTEQAIKFIEEANQLNKKVLISIPSDFGIDFPKHLNVIVIREQGYRSKLNDNHQCIPVLIPDPLKKHYQTTQVFKRPYTVTPTVGFCGQADSRMTEAFNESFKIFARNMLYYFKIRFKTPHQLIATKYLRSKLVDTLQDSPKINANFIIRKAHRAGVEFLKTKDTHKSTLEFFDNIKDSDYVLCARGVGNFSVRLYETLAMGRIPVFVNTDCMMPHDTYFNWKNYVVWVEYKDRHRIADKVAEFHANLNEESLNDFFIGNRKLWENKLKLDSYFKTLFNHLN